MVNDLERLTRGQSNNDEWFQHRKGRITGSVIHSVLTRSRRLLAGELDIDNTSLLKRLLYTATNPDIPALKYGREMEDEARDRYIRLMKEHGHTGVKVENCGLFIDKDLVYIGASPDAMIECPCCGQGVLEIKCPFSVAHTDPTPENLEYIEDDGEGNPRLKRSHPYFTQVQAQMGVTQRSWCHFFVYTRHGHLLVQVPFDNIFGARLANVQSTFFETS